MSAQFLGLGFPAPPEPPPAPLARPPPPAAHRAPPAAPPAGEAAAAGLAAAATVAAALAEKYLFGGCVVVRGRQKYLILGCVMCGVGHNEIFFGGCGLNPGLYGIRESFCGEFSIVIFEVNKSYSVLEIPKWLLFLNQCGEWLLLLT